MSQLDLSELIRISTKSRLETFLQSPVLAVEPVPIEELCYRPWMVLVLISGPKLRVTLKVHYKLENVQALVSKLFRVEPDQVKIDQANDCMREFCNLSAGALKLLLGNEGFVTATSLPIVARGWDEFFFASENLPGVRESWRLKLADGFVDVSSFTERFGQ